jgi:hypothetical protein
MNGMRSFKVPIGLSIYTVKFRKRITVKGIECEGFCDAENKVLWIERRPTELDVMFVNFWHEYAHALFFELGHPEFAHNEAFIESVGQNLARAARSLPKGIALARRRGAVLARHSARH